MHKQNHQQHDSEDDGQSKPGWTADIIQRPGLKTRSIMDNHSSKDSEQDDDDISSPLTDLSDTVRDFNYGDADGPEQNPEQGSNAGPEPNGHNPTPPDPDAMENVISFSDSPEEAELNPHRRIYVRFTGEDSVTVLGDDDSSLITPQRQPQNPFRAPTPEPGCKFRAISPPPAPRNSVAHKQPRHQARYQLRSEVGISNHEVRTLKDGTVIRGRPGVTFAGFIPPGGPRGELVIKEVLSPPPSMSPPLSTNYEAGSGGGWASEHSDHDEEAAEDRRGRTRLATTALGRHPRASPDDIPRAPKRSRRSS
ncbi:hypothetical protein F4777DRAFT_574945 [Nemania sp. FL0916]|nr:hypothetical protein F4777DRAFT_574945 [Nemania sp. FL0916]